MSDLCPVAVSHDSTEDEFQEDTIGESLFLLLKQKKYCDVTFIFPNLPDRIQAHEFCLKVRSPVFANIFRLRKSGNVQGNEIQISESTPQRFQQFLEFMYADKFEVDIAGALDLLQLSQKYKVHPLAKKCEELLQTEIQVEHSIKAFQAARCYGRQALMDRAGEIMVKSVLNLIKTGALLRAQEETVIYLLERDDLSIEEVELFQFIVDWGKCQVGDSGDEHTLKTKLKNVISKIRYTNMTLFDFTNVIVPTGFLSAEETLSVFSYFGGDEATRAALNLKFNTTKRKFGKEAKIIDFFIKQEFPSLRWAPAFSEQCLFFKVEHPQVTTQGRSGCLQKAAVISRIKFQWPRTRDKYMLDAIPNFDIIIRECAGPVTSRKNFKQKFRKSLVNCKEGVHDDIYVKPPVELICGRTYAVIVQNLSPVASDGKFQKDAYAYYGHVYTIKEREANGDVLDKGRLDLREISIKTDYFSDKFSNWDFFFAVIRGMTVELV